MYVFAIDDEPALLETLHEAIAEVLPGAEIADFQRGSEALAAIKESGDRPDLFFTDIRMPDIDGLHLATSVKKLSPDTRIIFTTAYPEYAMEAWKRHVHGYLLKPVMAEDIREAFSELPAPPQPPQDRLEVRCFGHFEVFWHGEPVIFQRKQSKELLAFLIDREGRACTAEEIAAALWEDEDDMQAAKNRIRTLLTDLRNTLRRIGMEEVLIRERRQLAVRRDRIDCDYYRLLDGDMEAVNAYSGQYMLEYSWAEMTAGGLWSR